MRKVPQSTYSSLLEGQAGATQSELLLKREPTIAAFNPSVKILALTTESTLLPLIHYMYWFLDYLTRLLIDFPLC
jgi:hypothetical protein